MRLPEYQPNLLPDGHYAFQISEEPERRKSEKGGVWLIIKFRATAPDGSIRRFTDLFFPNEERYKDLLFALGAEADENGIPHLSEINPVGLEFEADIITVPDPRDASRLRNRIANIQYEKFEDVPPPPKETEDDKIPF